MIDVLREAYPSAPSRSSSESDAGVFPPPADRRPGRPSQSLDPSSPESWGEVVDFTGCRPSPGGGRLLWCRTGRLSAPARARLQVLDGSARDLFHFRPGTHARLDVERLSTGEVRAISGSGWLLHFDHLPVTAEALALALWTPDDPRAFDRP